MENDNDKLKNVILELKLQSITKDIESLINGNAKEHGVISDSIIHLKSDIKEILDNVRATNGSIAKASLRINDIERDDYNSQINVLREETSFWRNLSNNKWIAILIIVTGYAFTIKEIRDLLFKLFGII